jgi:hypothetical protein
MVARPRRSGARADLDDEQLVRLASQPQGDRHVRMNRRKRLRGDRVEDADDALFAAFTRKRVVAEVQILNLRH